MEAIQNDNIEMNDGYYSEATGLQKLKQKASSNLKKKASGAKKSVKKKVAVAKKKVMPSNASTAPKKTTVSSVPKNNISSPKPAKKTGMSLGLKIGIGLGIAAVLTVVGIVIYKKVKS